jgi:hypothetical protein
MPEADLTPKADPLDTSDGDPDLSGEFAEKI